MKHETAEFLDQLEKYANRKLHFRPEVGTLIEIAKDSGKAQVFEDIVFFAKFISNSSKVMSRVGVMGEGYEKLAVEFKESLEKVSTLLKTLVKDSPEEIKTVFTHRFFQLDQESLEMFMKLLSDLTWVKNWVVDGSKLP